MSLADNPQVNLGAMLAKVADEVALGRFGDVHEVTVFLQGRQSSAIVTLPIEPPEATAMRLQRAVVWLETGELPA